MPTQICESVFKVREDPPIFSILIRWEKYINIFTTPCQSKFSKYARLVAISLLFGQLFSAQSRSGRASVINTDALNR